MPVVATLMMIGFMASLGLPGLVGFAGGVLGILSRPVRLGLACGSCVPIASVAITAAYYIWAMQRTIFGALTDKIDTQHMHDVYWFETIPLAALIGAHRPLRAVPDLVCDIIACRRRIPPLLTGVI